MVTANVFSLSHVCRRRQIDAVLLIRYTEFLWQITGASNVHVNEGFS